MQKWGNFALLILATNKMSNNKKNIKAVEKKENLPNDYRGEISKKYNISPMVVDLLVSRGYDSFEKIESFLNPSEELFYDPFLLRGMHSLVKRVKKAMDTNEKVLIFKFWLGFLFAFACFYLFFIY